MSGCIHPERLRLVLRDPSRLAVRASLLGGWLVVRPVLGGAGGRT
jgi:hypothetical protein